MTASHFSNKRLDEPVDVLAVVEKMRGYAYAIKTRAHDNILFLEPFGYIVRPNSAFVANANYRRTLAVFSRTHDLVILSPDAFAQIAR